MVRQQGQIGRCFNNQLYLPTGRARDPIHAIKDFKALNFKEILKEHLVENPDRYVEPNNSIGDWNKFIKNNIITTKNGQEKRADIYIRAKPVGCQPKKGGRGWLHTV
jgi:hypothetical protein